MSPAGQQHDPEQQVLWSLISDETRCPSSPRVTFERFLEYHQANPQVWEAFKRLAFEAISAGRDHYSSRDILAVLRWQTHLRTNDEAGFKLNNNWSPFYARLFEYRYPDHRGFFRKRLSCADELSL